MLRLLKQMKAKQWIMALLCVALILGQIYFDLRLPDYMSDLTVQIKTPGSTVSDVLHTGLEMLACTLISAVMAILCGYLNAQVAAGFSYHIRESVFQKVADFGQKEMLEFSVPSLINRTTNDITQIQMFVAMGMQTMIKAPVMALSLIHIWHFPPGCTREQMSLMLRYHLNAVVGLMRSWTEEDSAHIDETVRDIYRMMAASMNAFAPGGATRLPEKLKD